MMQSAKNGLRLDSPKSLNSTLNGCILAQGQVRAGCIVIIHVGRQHVAQVLLAEHDDMPPQPQLNGNQQPRGKRRRGRNRARPALLDA
jgi:hypothetical protein